ncbi:MAG: M16 family metallopeptidase [Actinomycetota bacterium]
MTIGAWVGSGARDEGPTEWGASHFLEHLLFKGTPTRSARDIAESIESVGGEMNACTTHEQTVFHIRVPDSRLGLALEVLADVLAAPAFRADEVESERRVILEEIGMRDDDPDDVVHEAFAAALFPDHPLGREVVGSVDSISGMDREVIADYHRSHYRPSNMVFAAAGNLTHDTVTGFLAEHLPDDPTVRPERPSGDPAPPRERICVSRDTEQSHVVLGVRALPALDPDRYALTVLNQCFGGGMSSRLFQEVREKRGLAYSVYSYWAGFADAGAFGIYAGTAPERLPEVLEVVEAELERLVADGIGADELAAAKGHLTGALSMSLETSASRMRRLGRAELLEGEIPSLDEIVQRVERVTGDDVARVIDRCFAGTSRTLALVGPHDEASL